MRISIEFKDKRYVVTYGKFIGSGPTVKDAVESLVTEFKKQISHFFLQ